MANALFIQDIEYDYLGIMYIAAVIKDKGHNCEVLIEHNPGKIAAYSIKNRFDIFAFSTMSGTHHWALVAASKLKNVFPKIPIIFGGVHPTYFPEIINEEPVDIICRGEGEYAMLDLMDALDLKLNYSDIPNLWIKRGNEIIKNEPRNLIDDLDILPFPDRELYYNKYSKLRNNKIKYFMASRGCPYNCTFCFNKRLKEFYKGKGKYIRFRSQENILEEIDYVKKNYPLKTIQFEDDVFIMKREWINKFLDEFQKRDYNISFWCLVRADLLDEELAKKLKLSGCKTVWFGLESGNREIRQKILKKDLTDKQIINAAELLMKYNIKFRAYCMIGIPGETTENAFETIELNVKIKTPYPWPSIFVPYSKSEIVNYAINKV